MRTGSELAGGQRSSSFAAWLSAARIPQLTSGNALHDAKVAGVATIALIVLVAVQCESPSRPHK